MVVNVSQFDARCLVFRKTRPILGDHPKPHIHEIRWISWNPADFVRISWNLADFVQISGEIWQILCGFQMKSDGFHADFRWNPADYTWNPPTKPTKLTNFERPIARNGKLYVLVVAHLNVSGIISLQNFNALSRPYVSWHGFVIYWK